MLNMKIKDNFFNKVTQFALPIFTILSQLMVAFKHPDIGLIINLVVQPFWIYSSWKAYKEAKQIGMLLTTIIYTIITIGGIINYWFL